MAQSTPPNKEDSIDLNDKLLRLPNQFYYFVQGILTEEELDSRIAHAGCHPVDLSRIPWKQIQHLVITDRHGLDPEKRPTRETGSYEAYLHEDANWLLVAWPSADDVSKLFECWTPSLKTLVLSGLTVSSIPSLARLHQLTSLEISGCKNLTTLPGLENLTQLISLDLSGCKGLTDLPKLEKLTQLTSLKLSLNSNFTELPELENLTQLKILNLSECDCLTGLHGLENLTQLTSLILSECDRLTDLPGLENLPHLNSLILMSCPGLKTLPEGLQHCKSLRQLALFLMHLTDLPDWLPEIAERITLDISLADGIEKAVVSLHRTTVESIPDMSIFEQPYEMVAEWFEKRRKGGSELLNEIKVIFLGNGDVGKTHTIARLMQDGGKPPESFTGSSTPGIIIENKNYQIDGQNVQVHFWDFGGQDILYSMHRMFMTDRTVYVIMVDARNETKSQQAREWLDTVKSFAPDAPVMLVINKNDQNPGVTIDETTLRREYSNLKTIFDMSALKDSPEEFNSKFTTSLLDILRESKILKHSWPKSWKQVKERLQNMASPYIFSRDYEQICAECNVSSNQENLLGWFHDLGISFCQYQDFRLKNYVILRPDWITNAIYTILFNKKKDVDNGMISHEEINSLLNPTPDRKHKIRRVRDESYQWQDIAYVLDVVRKFSLSYAADQNTEFFPMLCKEDSKPISQSYAEAPDTLEFHMEFEYLPSNVLHRLMVMRWAELDLENIWLTGAHFVERGSGLSAVVRIEEKILKIFIRASEGTPHLKTTYLSVLSGTVDQIRRDLKLPAPRKSLVYKLEEIRDVFDYEYLTTMLQCGETEIFSGELRRRLKISDIMNQAEPAAAQDEMKLLATIIEACQDLQSGRMYWGLEENDRNTVVRNKLRPAGYLVHDQTLDGRSSGGKRSGELDMDIRIRETTPWSICEALILKDGSKANWDAHLEKLLDNYNTHGLNFLILLSYVDCDKAKFSAIWDGKNGFTKHIPQQRTTQFLPDPESFRVVDGDQWHGNNLIKVAKCNYLCGMSQHTVYHIFIHMDKKTQ